MKIWKMLLCLAVMALLLGVAVASAEIKWEGTSGTCKWEIDYDGVLVIRPTSGDEGRLDNWSDSPPWYSHRYSLTEVRIEKTVIAQSCRRMFEGGIQLKSIDITGLDVSNVTNMAYMFSNCNVLPALNVSGFNTSKVTDMTAMFAGCSKLSELNVSEWVTSSVTNMGSMFSDCYMLSKLDVSKWKTSGVTNMSGMFYACHQLQALNVSGWNTSSVTNMSSMFAQSDRLENLDVSQWNTSSVTNMKSMFQGCKKLENLDVRQWKTSGVTNMGSMFDQCRNLTALDLSKWNTSNVEDMSFMFSACVSLEQLDISGWDTSKVTKMGVMFSYDTKLKKITIGANFVNPSSSSRAQFPVRMYEIAHGEDMDYSYAVDDRIPSSTNNDGAAVEGGTNIYVVGNIVSFNENGGTGTMDDQPFFYSLNAKNLSDNSFTYAGKVFTGWNTKANGTGTAYAASDLLSYESFSGDITLYAQWAPAAKITFDLAGGTLDGKTGSIVLTVPKGTDITILNAPEKEGFEFQYWEGSEYYPGQTYTANDDHTFTAKWGPKPTVPKTGDTARPALYLAFAALSALALLTLGRKRRAEK